MPEIKWKYKNSMGKVIYRDNVIEFIEAAEHIYDYLNKITGIAKNFLPVEKLLRKCFANSNIWSITFKDIQFLYNDQSKHIWMEKALKASGSIWDYIASATDIDPADFNLLRDRKYFYFHEAAAKQRRKVLNKIPCSAIFDKV